MNWEIYFFSTTELRDQFAKDPLASCGRLTDPVTHERFQPTAASPREDFEGRPYFFSREASHAAFRADPAKYAKPMLAMVPEPAAGSASTTGTSTSG